MRNHFSSRMIRIGLSKFVLVLTIFLYFNITISLVDSTPTEESEFSNHLVTLKTRYFLTNTLYTNKMKVSIKEGDRKTEELRELLWYKKSTDGSDLLRIQVLGAFNDTKGVAIANGEKFLLTSLDEQKTYHGKLSDGILRKIFGIDLRVSDVLSAIFANPFLDGRTKSLKIKKSGKDIVVTRPSIEKRHTETIKLHIKDEEPIVTEWTIKENNSIKQHVVFSEYKEVDGIIRANKVEIDRPPEQTRVVVKMEQVKINVDIKDIKFDFEPFLSDDLKLIPFQTTMIQINQNEETEGT